MTSINKHLAILRARSIGYDAFDLDCSERPSVCFRCERCGNCATVLLNEKKWESKEVEARYCAECRWGERHLYVVAGRSVSGLKRELVKVGLACLQSSYGFRLLKHDHQGLTETLGVGIVEFGSEMEIERRAVDAIRACGFFEDATREDLPDGFSEAFIVPAERRVEVFSLVADALDGQEWFYDIRLQKDSAGFPSRDIRGLREFLGRDGYLPEAPEDQWPVPAETMDELARFLDPVDLGHAEQENNRLIERERAELDEAKSRAKAAQEEINRLLRA